MNQKTFHNILQEMMPTLVKNSNILNALNFKLDPRSKQDIKFETPQKAIDTLNPYYMDSVNLYLEEHPGAKDFTSGLSIIMFKKLKNNSKYGSDRQKAGSVLRLSEGLSFTTASGNWTAGFKNAAFVIKFNRNIVTIEDSISEIYTLDLTGISEDQLLSKNNPLTPVIIKIIESYFTKC